MIPDFGEFSNKLRARLKEPLPGIDIHRLMVPKDRVLKPNDKDKVRESAVLLCLYYDEGEVLFPVIRRTDNGSIHGGQMALPGGKPESNDATLIDTALREAEEELGITNVTVLGTLSSVYIHITKMKVLPVVGVLQSKPSYSISKDEVDAVFDISLSTLISDKAKVSEEWMLRGVNTIVPFYYLQQQKVWGATAMMLSEFEYIMKDII